jgi:chromosome segregation ATPase
VFGRIGNLFRAKDVQKHGIALTEILGGRLFNVVVKSKKDATDILKFGNL